MNNQLSKKTSFKIWDFVKSKGVKDVPWSFWKAMLDHDHFVINVIADYFDDYGDYFFADAWREIAENNWRPHYAGPYDCYWFKEGYSYIDRFSFARGRSECSSLPDELFCILTNIEMTIGMYNPKNHTKIYQISRSVGIANAYFLLATAILVKNLINKCEDKKKF